MADLMNYLPDYYDGVYEMEAIMQVQGGVLDELATKQMRILLNLFVTQTDATGIAVYEDQVGIKPEPGDSLEERQNKVLMRLLPPRPITIRYLRELFQTLKIPVTVSVDYAKRNAIVEAKGTEVGAKQIDSIRYILNVYLPANMIYEIKIALKDVQVTNNLYVGIGILTSADVEVPANVSQFKN